MLHRDYDWGEEIGRVTARHLAHHGHVVYANEAYLGIAGGPRPLPPRLAAALGRKSAVEIVEVVDTIVVRLDHEPVVVQREE